MEILPFDVERCKASLAGWFLLRINRKTAACTVRDEGGPMLPAPSQFFSREAAWAEPPVLGFAATASPRAPDLRASSQPVTDSVL
jgi:hypothetical protein